MELIIKLLLLVLILVILFKVFYFSSESQVYHIKTSSHTKRGVVIDDHYFYTLGDDQIGKYNIKTGKRVDHKKFPITGIRSGRIIGGDFIVLAQDKLLWLDDRLEITDSLDIPDVNNVAWVDWAWNKWWVCAMYNSESIILCFNDDWVMQGLWKLPKGVPRSLTSGVWVGELLCVCGEDTDEMYVLRLPGENVHAKLIDTIPIYFEGKCFCFEGKPTPHHIWGVKNHSVIRHKIDFRSQNPTGR